jgi:hypothetical protein
MRQSRNSQTCVGLGILILMAQMFGCGGGRRLQGHIRDGGAQPVGGVRVVLKAEGYPSSEASSGRDGSYSVRMPDSGSDDIQLTLTADKPGYLQFRRHLTAGDVKKEQTVDIVMSPPRSLPSIMQPPGLSKPPNY